MKRFYTYFVLFFVGTLGMLTSCVEELDLSNIDTRSEVALGITLPLGQAHVSLGDLMNTTGLSDFFSIAEDGTFIFQDTLHYTMSSIATAFPSGSSVNSDFLSIHVQDTLYMTKDLGFPSSMREMKIPFAEPSVQIDFHTSLSSDWKMHIDTMYSANTLTNNAICATFNGATKYDTILTNLLGASPVPSDEEALYSIRFDNTAAKGHLDQCFTISPDLFIYDISLSAYNYPQVYIPAQPKIGVNVIASLPLAFNQIVDINYSDEINNIDLSELTLDSLLASVPVLDTVKKASIYLVMKATNDMPFSATGKFQFMDADGQDLHLLEKPLAFTALDTTSYIFEVHESDFSQFASIKQIAYSIQVDDEPLRTQPELYPIRLKSDQGLTLRLGFAGSVDAILNFNDLK